MAVTPRFAKDFWPLLRRRVTTAIVIADSMFLLVTIVILFSFNLFSTHLLASLLVIATVIAGSALMAWWLVTVLTQPTKDLLGAIVQISGERGALPPPNPNERRFEANGFKDILLTLYELAQARDFEPGEAPVEIASEAIPTSTQQSKPVAIGTGEKLIQDALDKTSSGFVVMNHDRQITFNNRAAPLRVDQAGVKSIKLLFPSDNTLEMWLDECEQSAVHAEKTWVRIPDRMPDEEGRRFFDVSANYDKGSSSETVLTLVDRTSVYEVGEQELDFIAFAAHELRGPITVIRGYLDVLQDELSDVLKDDQNELFHRLTVSANRLTAYVNNILNTSRYDRRHLKLHLIEANLADVYDMIEDDMALRASAQGRLLSVNVPDTLPTIATDPTSLSEVIGNLIDNAIKYSSAGGAIEVAAAQKGDTVELTVTDHGIGMPGSVVSNLFQKFYRSHRSRETVAGTGIGLYISKAIVESHGGTITVRSDEGVGSTFTIILPTFATVADKLKESDNSNEGMIKTEGGWIKNHSAYRG